MNTLLLCPPTAYDIVYKINPWMDVTKKVDQQKVLKEYQELKNVYKELGCKILEIEQKEDLPDMVYVANYGFVKNKTFIKANFTFEQRKGEAELAKHYFQRQGYIIEELPETINWEGQGDLLEIGRAHV